ncbi:MAG: hypothetical protein ABSH24_22090 [Bryobacteraceae bacterium]|jgi:hypothetical protein
MKRIRFEPNVPFELRAIAPQTALGILKALHRYAEPGHGETADTITVHRVRDRRDAYQ